MLMRGAVNSGGAGGGGGPPGGGFGGRFAPGAPPPPVAQTGAVPVAKLAEGKDEKAKEKSDTGGGPAGEAPAMRLREYFPETLLWKPALITDDKGVVEMPLTFADSITTW